MYKEYRRDIIEHGKVLPSTIYGKRERISSHAEGNPLNCLYARVLSAYPDSIFSIGVFARPATLKRRFRRRA